MLLFPFRLGRGIHANRRFRLMAISPTNGPQNKNRSQLLRNIYLLLSGTTTPLKLKLDSESLGRSRASRLSPKIPRPMQALGVSPGTVTEVLADGVGVGGTAQ